MAWSLQKYLIFAILSCVPDRQRTLRELELGRTLFKEGDRCSRRALCAAFYPSAPRWEDRQAKIKRKLVAYSVLGLALP